MAIPRWTKKLVSKLAANWITTAEQVVGMGTTPQGLSSLAQQLGVSESRMRRLVDQARSAFDGHPLLLHVATFKAAAAITTASRAD
jgi:hypothetical protein